jgi:hypothetical protein
VGPRPAEHAPRGPKWPWRVQNETSSLWFTQEGRGGGAVFAIALAWPPSGALVLAAPIAAANAT